MPLLGGAILTWCWSDDGPSRAPLDRDAWLVGDRGAVASAGCGRIALAIYWWWVCCWAWPAELRGGAAVGESLVSAEVSGLGDGHCRAGNSGTALAMLYSRPPWPGSWAGERVWPGAIRILTTLAVFFIFAKDSPNQPRPRAWPTMELSCVTKILGGSACFTR